MKTVVEVEALRDGLQRWRSAGERIALVATMGNLHQGHLRLVAEARKRADRVVVTIFVNPMQFSAGEDLSVYPRTLGEDQQKLQAAGADLLFMPQIETIYPRGVAATTQVLVAESLSEQLCGLDRPGHFVGVATVVSKLFNLVQPQVALFGQKDYQQLLVIRRFCEDLNFPVQIVGVTTEREADGLAMSSRNGYLTAEQRVTAPMLYRQLHRLAKHLLEGYEPKQVCQQCEQRLNEAGFSVDYVEVRRASDLSADLSGTPPREWVVLVAAQLGAARLIDNILLADVVV